jgi:hypothetical protein
VPRIDAIAHRLSDQMRAECPAAKPIPVEMSAEISGILLFGQRTVDFEVVSPACELETVESPSAALRRQFGELQVGPLAGEQRHSTRH